MRIITTRDEIRTVAQRWHDVYLNESSYYRTPDRLLIYERLLELDVEVATEADVTAIIGNSSWTDLGTCHECGQPVGKIGLELGAEQDHEYVGPVLCRGCAEMVGRYARSIEEVYGE